MTDREWCFVPQCNGWLQLLVCCAAFAEFYTGRRLCQLTSWGKTNLNRERNNERKKEKQKKGKPEVIYINFGHFNILFKNRK